MKFMFDCDDTLYNLRKPFEITLEKLLPDLLEHDLQTLYVQYRKAGDEVFDQVQAGTMSIDQSGEYRIQRLCEIYQCPLSLQQACSFQKEYRFQQSQISMFPEIKTYFKKTDATLAILTNGEDQHQRMKLQALQVYDFIPLSHTFTSGQLQVAKPDANAFLLAIEQIDQDASGWCYIGDNYHIDMEGAKAAGLTTIHFNHHHNQEGPASDYVAYTVQDLISLLETLENQ